ncbi:hypothetical protein CDIK_0469 [Cucumispora dikerogammari]|nr:hypothetical protein CDIK_0469 [Cucumispora dikerogammari]
MVQYIYFLLFSLFGILIVNSNSNKEYYDDIIKIKAQPHIVDLTSEKDECLSNSKYVFGKNKNIEFQITFGNYIPDRIFETDCVSIRKNLEIESLRKNADLENQYEKIEMSAVDRSDIISHFQFERSDDFQQPEVIYTCKVTHDKSGEYNPVIKYLKKNPEIAIRFVLKLEPLPTHQVIKPFILKTNPIRLDENTQGELTQIVMETEKQTVASHKPSFKTQPFKKGDQQRVNTSVQSIPETDLHHQGHTTKRPSFTKHSEIIRHGRETRSTGSNKPNSQIQKSSWRTWLLFILGGVLIFISILLMYLIIIYRKTLEARGEDTNNKNDNI